MVYNKATGPIICMLLGVLGVLTYAGTINGSVNNVVSALLILVGAILAVKSPARLAHLSDFYLWLVFVSSLGWIEDMSRPLARLMGMNPLPAYGLASGVHLLLIAAALGVLGAWRIRREPEGSSNPPLRWAAGPLILGSAVFGLGATTFPGTTLESIAANVNAHALTSWAFLAATVMTLAGFVVLTLALRDAGDRLASVLGLVAYLFGAILWFVHLSFRLTIMSRVALDASVAGGAPEWYGPWRFWAGLLFASYNVLAYLAILAYGVALLKTRVLGRWVGWTCIGFSLVAAPSRLRCWR